VFLDPFYSPGSDFIAIANTYITELIAHDRAERPVLRTRALRAVLLSFYDSSAVAVPRTSTGCSATLRCCR
jgi:hypothetical protein